MERTVRIVVDRDYTYWYVDIDKYKNYILSVSMAKKSLFFLRFK